MPCLMPYVQEAVINPTLPVYEGFTPAWGQANAEQLWGQAHADVIKNGMTQRRPSIKRSNEPSRSSRR